MLARVMRLVSAPYVSEKPLMSGRKHSARQVSPAALLRSFLAHLCFPEPTNEVDPEPANGVARACGQRPGDLSRLRRSWAGS